MISYKKVTEAIDGKDFSLETGKLAKQANGSIFAQLGETQVLATVVSTKEPVDDNFLPLTVNYQEKAFAAGKIPGGYFKREGRPTESETLISRLIDRPLRPLFPRGYNFNTQIIITVYSADDVNPPDVLAITAASAALTVSDVPFEGPLAGVRVVRVDKKLICNPSYEEIEKADLNFIIAGSSEAIMMVEGGANTVPEDEVLAALMFGHDKIKEIINLQNQLVSDEIIKREFTVKEKDKDLEEKIVKSISSDLNEAIRVKLKQERSSKSSEAYQKAFDELSIEDDFNEKEFKEILTH